MPGTSLNEQHVGIHHLHDDVSINFQLNRWVAWTGGDALPDIRSIAGRLTDFANVGGCSFSWPRLR